MENVRVKVRGYVTLSKENLERLKAYDDIHQAITYALHCQYIDTTFLEYEEEGEREKQERLRYERQEAKNKASRKRVR